LKFRSVVGGMYVDLKMRSPYVQLFKYVGMLVVAVHVAACAWHFVGYEVDNGWVHSNGFSQASHADRYVISVHMIYARLQGTNEDIIITTSSERLVDSAMNLLALIAVLTCICAVNHWWWLFRKNNKATNLQDLQRFALTFARRHRIAERTCKQVLKHLDNQARVADTVAEDSAFIDTLPRSLQADLNHQTRLPLVLSFQCMTFLAERLPRASRHMCHEALFSSVIEEDDTVFDCGDACSRMLFVAFGELVYSAEEAVLEETPRIWTYPRERLDDGKDLIRKLHLQ